MIHSNINPFNNISNITTKCEICEDIPEWKNKLNNELFTVIHVNLNSIRAKWDLLCLKIEPVLKELDLLILTEIDVNEEQALAFQLRGFQRLSKCRVRRKKGGIMIFYRDGIQVENLCYNFEEAESLIIKVTDPERKLECTVLAIYRPPNLNINKFLDDLNFWLQNGCKRDENILLVGDINICIHRKSSRNQNYLNILFQNTLLPMIRDITREEICDGRLTRTSIDHMNVRFKREMSCTATVIQDKLADHYFIALRVSDRRYKNTAKKLSINKIVLDSKKVQTQIETTNWMNIQGDDPDQFYSKMINEFNKIYNTCTKTVTIREKDPFLPWVSERIRHEILLKQNLLRLWRNNKNNRFNYERFKKQRNIVTNLMKKEKRIFMYKKFAEARGDMRRTWALVNELMDRKTKEPPEEKLQRNFQTKDSQLLANNFNKNFVEQISHIKSINQGPDLSINMLNFEPPSNECNMYLRRASEQDIQKILKNMKKTGRGIDGLRSIDIINNIQLFTPMITYLINLFIQKSYIPDDLKISCITPIYKKNKVDDLSNYRPVGSMPIIEKILEKHINNQTKKYLIENKILPDFQHGFQAGKSTMTLLLEFSDLINTALDNRNCVVIIYLDLSLAFDTCNHSILCKKFKEIGINHPLLLNNFFINRKQITRIGKIQSDPENVLQGLVQGGINSPTWFNIYTYDIQYVRRKGVLKMFADDSCIISIHKDVKTAIQNAQSDFIEIQKYFYKNSIYLNDKKTETMIFGFASKQIDLTAHRIYCHSRDCLSRATYEFRRCSCHQSEYNTKVKYLGMFIDRDFKMKDHVYNLSKKLRIIDYKFRKTNTDGLPLSTKKNHLLFVGRVSTQVRSTIVYLFSSVCTYTIEQSPT